MNYHDLPELDKEIFNPNSFSCPMALSGKRRFNQLFDLLIEKGFKRFDRENDIFISRHGFTITVGSNGGGDTWLVRFDDGFNIPNSYWDIEILRKRIESPVPFKRLR